MLKLNLAYRQAVSNFMALRADPAAARPAGQKLHYRYDLLSGNVQLVAYQPMEADAFYHHYRYDADNRLTQAYTSADGYLWSRDAEYFYYAHGPLARTELGHHKVQGLDYTYTLQGWIKGINAFTTDLDGSTYGKTTPDAFSYRLDYFTDDYTSISGSSLSYAPGLKSLYNGNIAGMSTGLWNSDEEQLDAFDQLFRHDQLNRLISSELVGSNAFRTQYSYDADGNLQSLQRNDADGNLMHDLRYSYNSSNNQLLSLVNQGIEKERLAQKHIRIGYVRKIGQLTSDLGQGLNSIGWTVYNKVEAAEKTDGSTLSYRYNAGGNRVYKKHTAADDTEKVTHYIHDASGNTMAIYEDGEVEHYLYGSERIGSYKRAETPDLVRSLGTRSFDLKTQTNNVVAKVSDKKLTNGAGGFKTDVLFRSMLAGQPVLPLRFAVGQQQWRATAVHLPGPAARQRAGHYPLQIPRS